MGGLRVLHVINKLSPSGGAEVSLRQLLPQFQAHGLQQQLVTLLPNTAVEEVAALDAAGVRVRPAGGSSLRVAVPHLRAVARDFRPHLISSTLYEANRAARIVGALEATPVLCGLVNTPYSAHARAHSPAKWKLGAVAALEGALARHLTSHFHALTDAAAASAIDQLRISRERVSIVPRGRDRGELGEPTAARRAEVRARLGWADDDLVVLNVARQERQKGQVLLVEAFAHVAAQHPRARLAVAGRPGAASSDLAAAAAASPATARISLLGLRRDVPDLLSAADAFAFSSLWEGLGGSVLEAMAMGVPVVTFAEPAVEEALGGRGVTVPLGDAAALGRAVAQLLADPQRARTVGAEGRERFDAVFALDRIVPRMVEVYERAASAAAPGRRAARATP